MSEHGLPPMNGVREETQYEAERYGRGVLKPYREEQAQEQGQEGFDYGWELPGGRRNYGEYQDLDWLFSGIDWFNGWMMQMTQDHWWQIVASMIFVGSLFRMVPFQMHYTHSFSQVCLVYVRKIVFWGVIVMAGYPVVVWLLYISVPEVGTSRTTKIYLDWISNVLKNGWSLGVWAVCVGVSGNLLCSRYLAPIWSGLMRKIRVRQYYDEQSDIRNEAKKFKVKNFTPKRHYKKGAVFVGVDVDNRPIRVDLATWRETNMQIIGPTRFGKGVILGTLMDQAIRRGDGLVYIDPKNDRFAPHVMYQAAVAMGRPFHYLTLNDNGVGSWAPFEGGPLRDGLSRLELSFWLELTGEAGSDFYKSQKRRVLEREFAKRRGIAGLYEALHQTEAFRILAELDHWRAVESLCPVPGKGFNVADALRENAVVYVQGHLFDSVVKAATKAFIVELIQESRRLVHERKAHLTVAVDEVSFLTSKPLAQALATSVGFNCNFILAYQSQNDLLNLEDRGLNARYIYQSINVNSQLKAVYAGADRETAEWASSLSGTIVKDITKMERTEINEAGGERFEKQRMLGVQEENYIHSNQILSLPPRVFVFFQPAQLAQIGFCSFVRVKNERNLEGALNAERMRAQGSPEPEEKEEGGKKDVVPGSHMERGHREEGGQEAEKEKVAHGQLSKEVDQGGSEARPGGHGQSRVGDDGQVAKTDDGPGSEDEDKAPAAQAEIARGQAAERVVEEHDHDEPGLERTRGGSIEEERRGPVELERRASEERKRSAERESDVMQLGCFTHVNDVDDEASALNVADEGMMDQS